MLEIAELRTTIRDFIHHPRRLDPLLKDKPNWNQLASAFDTIADTELAIKTYLALPAEADSGMLYLVIYGLLQSLYVQQDAVESLVRAFWPNQTPKYRIEGEPEAEEIRAVRNRAVGHPTVQGDVNAKKKPGIQWSFHIVRHSMSTGGFTLMTTFADGTHTFAEINLLDLIDSHKRMVTRILQRIKHDLEAAEMEHRKHFCHEKLADLFPPILDYHFEKVFEGVYKPDKGFRDMGQVSLKIII